MSTPVWLKQQITRYSLVTLFILAGIIAVVLRLAVFDQSRLLNEDQIWKISIQARINAQQQQTLLHTLRPKKSRHNRVIGQALYHPDFRLLPARDAKHPLTARALTTGKLDWLVSFQVLTTPESQPLKSESLTVEQRARYLSAHRTDKQNSLGQLNQYLAGPTHAQPELIHHLFLYSHKIISSTKKQYDETVNIIKDNKATPIGRVNLLVDLLRLNNIPARTVSGLMLDENANARLYRWLEYYNDDRSEWIAMDPIKGFENGVPQNYLAFTYEGSGILAVDNGDIVEQKISIEEDTDASNIISLEQEKNILDIFDLRRFDIETRITLMQLLLLPFCVLLTAFLRHVLGFFPYGTFTATLLSLAMVYAELQITLIIALIVIILALAGRSIMPDSLSRTPRLSLIFTFVVIAMVAAVSILSYLDISASGNIILLPTIILVSIVDRFYSYMDASGAHAALIRLWVTIGIALACTPILGSEQLGELILNYPEIHFFTAALILMLSAYKGPKMTDYSLLRLFGENRKKKENQPDKITNTSES